MVRLFEALSTQGKSAFRLYHACNGKNIDTFGDSLLSSVGSCVALIHGQFVVQLTA